MNRELERVIPVLPRYAELSAAVEPQLTRELVVLRGTGKAREDHQAVEETINVAELSEGWGVLVQSGCVVDDLLVSTMSATISKRLRKGPASAE